MDATDDLFAVPTLDVNLTVDSRGVIINLQSCCILCHASYHCGVCHPDPRV